MTAVEYGRSERLSITEADVAHWVCHCTNDEVAACGLDVANVPLVNETEQPDCPLCALAWSDAPTCPWGCSCDECASD